jgi:sulfur relay (sulfurtransferase) DsrC/TusE family protein
VEEVNSHVICLIYFKNFYKCHNVPPPSTTIKKIMEKKVYKMQVQYSEEPRDESNLNAHW